MEQSQLDAMASLMKQIGREKAALAKHNAVAGDFDNTSARRNKAREAARECAVEIRRLTHEAHCVAVEMGIADRRDDSHYTPSTAPAGFGRTVIFDRRAPRVGATA